MKTNSLDFNQQRALSDCCNATVNTMPAIMGEPAMDFCSACHNECTYTLKPRFKMVAKGQWRPIKYTKSK